MIRSPPLYPLSYGRTLIILEDYPGSLKYLVLFVLSLWNQEYPEYNPYRLFLPYIYNFIEDIFTDLWF